MNPSFAATRIERSLAVWVHSTTGSPGSASANQPSPLRRGTRYVVSLEISELPTCGVRPA
jgi:hypothetical protein